MDIKQLVRDKQFILSVLEKVGGQTRVKKECRIIIPARYLERGLATIGTDVYTIGILPIICENKFSTMIVNAMVKLEPAMTNRISVNDEENIEFIFPAGSVMIANNNVVRININTYRVFEELHSSARVPWFITYNQMASIYASAGDYADANIGANHESDELLASVIARNPDNRRQYYRQSATSDSDDLNNQPVYVSMKNVAYSATNTMSRMGGSHFTNGTISALVSPTERVEPMERLIRA